MKIGLIHALTSSVEPIVEAFREKEPQATSVHLMDTELLALIQKHQALTPLIVRRFTKLVDLAEEANVDCIQLTCSAFNEITSVIQPLYSTKLFRSDEAMLDLALQYRRIGLISTVTETPPALLSYLRKKKADIEVQTEVNTAALRQLFQGNQKKHDEMVQHMIYNMDGHVDVVVLSQYSMAHIAKQVDVSVPVLTGPKASAERCLDYVKRRGANK